MNRNEKIVVTGATGLLGGELTLQLVKAGYTHIVLPVRNMARTVRLLERLAAEGLDSGAVHPVEASLSFPEQMCEVLQGAAMLFHCAATVDFGDRAGTMIATNVEITSTLVDAALACRVGRMIHVSSIATLVEGDPITERHPLESIARQAPYTISKVLAEQQVRRGMEQGLEAVIVHPAVILGEGDWSGAGSSAIVKLVTSGLPFYTDGVTGYVDVRDTARAMILLAECSRAAGESFILCGDNPSFRTVITLAAEAAGKPRPRIRARRWMLLAGLGVERILALAGRRPRFSRMAIRSATTVNRYDGSKVKNYVDFEYTPFAETLRRVAKACREKR